MIADNILVILDWFEQQNHWKCNYVLWVVPRHPVITRS